MIVPGSRGPDDPESMLIFHVQTNDQVIRNVFAIRLSQENLPPINMESGRRVKAVKSKDGPCDLD